MQINKYLTAGLLATFAFTACGGGAGGGHPGTTPPNVPNQSNLTTNVLQFSVGTANIAGSATTGLNVVATYRQPKGGYAPGDAGSLVNAPTLTVPGALPTTPGSVLAFDSTVQGTPAVFCGPSGQSAGGACTPGTVLVPAGNGGPSSAEAGGHVMTATSQVGSNSTTFGLSGGVFGLGIEPFNYQEGDLPASEAPYSVPLYDTKLSAGDPNAFEAWGGLPAFNPTLNGASGDLGISLGLDVFQSVAPTAGLYELNVSVPANTGTVSQTASASIPAAATLLGTATSPVLVPDGNGGGTFAFTMPTGATEAYIEVIDYGPQQPTAAQQGATPPYVGVNSCLGASTGAPIYYTIEATASGTYTLPDGDYCTQAQNAAAAVNPAPTAPALTIPVNGDQVVTTVIGFDYPAYEASYPNSLGNPAPPIVGAAGTSDITISAAACLADTTGGAALTSCTASLPLNSLAKNRKAAASAKSPTMVKYH